MSPTGEEDGREVEGDAAYTAPLVTVTTVFGVGVCDRLLKSDCMFMQSITDIWVYEKQQLLKTLQMRKQGLLNRCWQRSISRTHNYVYEGGNSSAPRTPVKNVLCHIIKII